jgi:hypothetical protein
MAGRIEQNRAESSLRRSVSLKPTPRRPEGEITEEWD